MPKVALIMGSKSDLPVLESCIRTLRRFSVTCEVLVASAHRTPDVVADFAHGARENGFELILAAAGKAAHLAGVIAGHTTLPVIGIPIKSSLMDGLDSLLSMVQMPNGIPVATMAVNGAENAALFAVQALSLKYPALVDKLAEHRAQMAADVQAQNEQAQEAISSL